jgi:hypothetical protein
MKKLMFVMLVSFLLIFGCSKDDPLTQDNENAVSDQNLKCKPQPLTLPMKVWFSSKPDLTVPPLACSPVESGMVLAGGMWVSGHATFVGKVNTKKSYCTWNECYFSGPGQLTSKMAGTITAADGSSFFYTGTCVTNFADMTFTGPVITTGGTGRFKGCTGLVQMNGKMDPTTGGGSWTAEGTITFPDKNKHQKGPHFEH